MKLIVGLGNPGQAYANNRHNIGFMCLSHFARAQGIKLDKKQGKARIGTGEIAGIRVVLARPQTYMNESGEAVSRLVKRFDIDPGELVVIHDDLDLPLGKLRIRKDGSSGGHKGIESIISCLGSQDFVRVRVGIGRPMPAVSEMSEADIIDYVLSDFTADQVPIVSAVISRVGEAIYCLLTEALTAAMNKYNQSLP
jgi:PTH1 family peptidyl-tRNA hydrolase